MQVRQKQSFEALRRVQAFLADNPLPPPGSYGGPKELLDDVVARLTGHVNDQVTGGGLSKAEISNQGILRKVLREQHLRPIAKIASAMLRGAPGIDKATKVPRARTTVTQLLAYASSFRTAAAPYEAVFVKNGRPADFLARLDAAANDLLQAQLGQARNFGNAVGAKEGMQDEIARGRDAVEMLDAIVTTAFAGNGQILGRWRSARRVRGLRGGGVRTPSADVGGTASTQAPALADLPPKAA